MEEGKDGGVDLAAQLEAERQARIKLEEDLALTKVREENYKVAALKRKGKLENDESFFGEHDESDIERTVEAKALAKQKELETQRAIEAERQAREKAERELKEIKLAVDNKPDGAISGGAAAEGGQEVKDSVFSEAQIEGFKNKWTRMGFSEEQQKRMLETEKRNALTRRSLS